MRLAPRVLALAVLAAACAPQSRPVDTAAEEAAIRAIDKSWNEYLVAQNDSAVAAVYGADAAMYPPNGPKVTGADNIRKFWAQLWPMKASLVIIPGTIRVIGDWAIEDGTWTFAVGETRDNGKYVVNWQKQGGTWKVVYDIWNSDTPPPAPPPPAKK